jgi:hypothetical protein
MRDGLVDRMESMVHLAPGDKGHAPGTTKPSPVQSSGRSRSLSDASPSNPLPGDNFAHIRPLA